MLAIVKRFASTFRSGEAGQATAWFVGIIILLFGIFAFSIDVGFWFVDRRDAQNQADAAVLAGVQRLPATNVQPAADAAQAYLDRNRRLKQDDADELVSLCAATGEYTLVVDGFAFADEGNDGTYDKIRACIKRDGFLLFGRIWNMTGLRVPAHAAAGLEWEPARYALMAMNPDPNCGPSGGDGAHSLEVQGNPIINLLADGASYTASPCNSEALYVQGDTATLNGDFHDFCGGAGGNGDLIGTLNPGVCEIPDPWASEIQPVPDSDCVEGPYDDSAPLPPQTYCDELGSGNWVFLPGVHIFTKGMKVTATDSSLTGEDVVLYFTCETGSQCDGDQLDNMEFNGGDIDLSAPDTAPGIVIWFDRTAGFDSVKAHIDWRGNGVWTVDGNIYDWHGTIEMNGTNDGANQSFNGTILGDRIDFGGDATYNITWDENQAPKISVITLIE